MEFKLPEYVLYCLESLENSGFEAWCVGGAVRDHVMGKLPFDYDITTNAKPDDITNIFPRTVPTGLQHGTVTVVTDGGNVEITTYRADGDYLDHRTPESVTFVNTVDADLNRRDFTMNAICYNPKKGFYDPLNGISDINNKIIRAIGDPIKRFTEDALRIMRAFRFSAQLGFCIEEKTKKAALSLSATLSNVSTERIQFELKRTLTAKYSKNIEPLFQFCAFSRFGFPSIEFPENFDLLPNDYALRLACLCRLCEVYPKNILPRLKVRNTVIDNATAYFNLLRRLLPRTKTDLKHMLRIAITPLQVQNVIDVYTISGIDTEEINKNYREILDNNEPYCFEMLDINGNDLIKLGFKDKQIGEKLEFLLEEVIKDPSLNQKELLIAKLK